MSFWDWVQGTGAYANQNSGPIAAPGYVPDNGWNSTQAAIADLIQQPIDAANAVYDPVAEAAKRTFLLAAGIGIILVTVITSGDDD